MKANVLRSFGVFLLVVMSLMAKETNASTQANLLTHVKAFLSTLNQEARNRTLFPYEDAERMRWSRSPERRKGLAIREMSAAQRNLVDEMLKTVLSEEGYKRAKAIMTDQNVLARTEEGMGAGFYWVAIYGEPGSLKTWAWRLGGRDCGTSTKGGSWKMRS